MSPWMICQPGAPSSFPRVSGDEPFEGDVDLLTVEFSPRERG